MFNKKECRKCGEKINKKYSFCPNCGTPLNFNQNKENEEDWGMLGKNDLFEESNLFSNSLFGRMGNGIMNKMFDNAMKMLEKEMQKEMKGQSNFQNPTNFPKTKFRLMINGKEVNLNNLNSPNQTSPQTQIEKKTKPKKIKFKEFSDEQVKKFSKLKKAEPKTNLKRMDDKLLYELEIPGISSLDDVSVISIENGIEIRALTKDKAYSKLIPINLPIINCDFSKDSLVLEFQGN